jgi:hypothetical protein
LGRAVTLGEPLLSGKHAVSLGKEDVMRVPELVGDDCDVACNLLKLLATLQNRLRLSLIIPETRVDNLGFDLAQFPALGFRVKDNSGCPGFGFLATEIPGSILQA